MMAAPIVTVICLCHNQASFVREAIQSVMDQSYPNVQLLMVDDASTDNSVEIIRSCLLNFPDVKFFALSQNVGSCKAFNYALKHARGEFIIDLAADDILLSDRIAEGVKALQEAGNKYGVNFSDAWWIAEDGAICYRHSDRFPHRTIPEGDIYRQLISRFFICSPAMMFRSEVIRSLGGYDESLHYEDFDFWIRSSRRWWYCYTPKALVKKRIVRGSMSQRQFSFFSPQLYTTYRVCKKILALNRTADEQKALRNRIWYEMRVCLRLLCFRLVLKYGCLLISNERKRYSSPAATSDPAT